jgi:hypothetical protein
VASPSASPLPALVDALCIVHACPNYIVNVSAPQTLTPAETGTSSRAKKRRVIVDTDEKLDRGPRRKPPAVKILQISDWLATPAYLFVQWLPPPRTFRDKKDKAATVNVDWAAWIRDLLAPNLWQAGGQWTRLAPVCRNARATALHRSDASVKHVRDDLVRLIMCNAFARGCGINSIHDLPYAQRSTAQASARDQRSTLGRSGAERVTLGLLIELAFALDTIAEFHRLSTKTAIAGILEPPQSSVPCAASHMTPRPVSEITANIIRVTRKLRENNDNSPRINADTAAKLKRILEEMQAFSDRLLQLDLVEYQLPGISTVSTFWSNAITNFCIGLPPVPFKLESGDSRGKVLIFDRADADEWMRNLFDYECAMRWSALADDILAARVQLNSISHEHDTLQTLSEMTVRLILHLSAGKCREPFVIDEREVSEIAISHSRKQAQRLTFRLLVDLAISIAELKTYLMSSHQLINGSTQDLVGGLDPPHHSRRSMQEDLEALFQEAVQGEFFFTKLVSTLYEAANVMLPVTAHFNARIDWSAKIVDLAMGHAVAYPHPSPAQFPRQLKAISNAFQRALRLAIGHGLEAVNSQPCSPVQDERYGIFRCSLDALIDHACGLVAWDSQMAIALVDSAMGIGKYLRQKFDTGQMGYPLHFYRSMQLHDAVFRLFGANDASNRRKLNSRVGSILRACPRWAESEWNDHGFRTIMSAAQSKSSGAMDVYAEMKSGNERFKFMQERSYFSEDRSEALKIVLEAFKLGSSYASTILVDILLNPNKTRIQSSLLREGLESLKIQAADDGYVAFQLAYYYENFEESEPRTFALATRAYESVLDMAGAPDYVKSMAANNLGWMHASGKGCPRNTMLAARRYEDAIELGSKGGRVARTKLADLLRCPWSDVRDLSKAQAHYRAHFKQMLVEDYTWVSVYVESRSAWIRYRLRIPEEKREAFISNLGELTAANLSQYGSVCGEQEYEWPDETDEARAAYMNDDSPALSFATDVNAA